MKIDSTAKCTAYPTCDTYSPIPLETDKTLNVDKTNTLHQFDTVNIVGVESPVGKVPIVFYVKEGNGRGRRGIIYDDDYDSVCFMYPETEHAEWCSQPYDLKYDGYDKFDNGVERGIRRNHGIFELWADVYREWYNGQVMYRPRLKIQGCSNDNSDGYPAKSVVNVVEEKKEVRRIQPTPVKKKRTGCGCGKGA